jgi:hypothetical protein
MTKKKKKHWQEKAIKHNLHTKLAFHTLCIFQNPPNKSYDLGLPLSKLAPWVLCSGPDTFPSALPPHGACKLGSAISLLHSSFWNILLSDQGLSTLFGTWSSSVTMWWSLWATSQNKKGGHGSQDLKNTGYVGHNNFVVVIVQILYL